ncbi:MAG TPA: TlpA disulfide reductase family protein [Candidatus Acidoferrum sp.]|nr:TlpA disulfide reductase family protein [Candidatus Acidoferrum sp.]
MTKHLLRTAIFGIAATGWSQSLSGLWDATVQVNDLTVPFRIELTTSSTEAKGAFFNGDDRVDSSAGTFQDHVLRLEYDYLATHLQATLQDDGTLTGDYGREGRLYPFRARRFAPSTLSADDVPAVAGLWQVAVNSPKGESAWRLIIRQSGPEVSAAILRVDGDTGLLTGAFHDGKFVLSHFSGARPAVLEIMPQTDGTLSVLQNGRTQMVATRSDAARAQGLPEPTDPSRHTSVKDPTAPFHFRFPDLDGHPVADTDARFQDKVIVLAIGGSWCPNCHDEAPFLVELYRRYHTQGLEIVGLSFEEADQLKNPARLRAFIRKYGIEYPVLVPGEPSELAAKLPQAVNLNAWPTTIFIGRDGRVRSVHAGFAAPASGEFHTQLKREVTTLVERLLAETAVASR